ncbi:AsmA family protein [Methylobrevis pamukkalensis]|uniref:AsmA family protein n=1 Tax=Methylobrevis pamukkalensis TaxID=1439726 RepID=A0A1E3H351_9HYPH|nr:AsmA family protein [Methylobrevis pamukkalensis]
MIGHPVRVDGTADAQLLPLPSLTFTDVRIGEAGVAPLMTVKRFAVRVELFPLLTGEVRVVEMALDEPSANIRITEEGGFEWLSAREDGPIDPRRVVLERVDIRNGRVSVVDLRRKAEYVVTDIDALVDARSLAGPYKLDAAVSSTACRPASAPPPASRTKRARCGFPRKSSPPTGRCR